MRLAIGLFKLCPPSTLVTTYSPDYMARGGAFMQSGEWAGYTICPERGVLALSHQGEKAGAGRADRRGIWAGAFAFDGCKNCGAREKTRGGAVPRLTDERYNSIFLACFAQIGKKSLLLCKYSPPLALQSKANSPPLAEK